MAHSQNGIEHRWGERAPVNLSVYVSASALREVDACMQNLSLSGAPMKAECDLRLHTLIAVRIELPPPLSHVAVLNARKMLKWATEQRRGADPCNYYNVMANPGVSMDIRAPQRVFIDLLEGLSATSSVNTQTDLDAARSKENVLQWMAYLPEDCIKTMIRMGWDVST